MKLSELLRVQPRITLALVEESAGAFVGNGMNRGRDAEWYDAKLTYCYETDDSGLGVTVECVAKYDQTTGIARIVGYFDTTDGHELWATGVDELASLENAHSFFVDNLVGELKGFDVAKLFEAIPFKDTKTFILEWI